MATLLASGAKPRCSQCLRQVFRGSVTDEFWRPFQQQIRGKKKLKKLSETVTVRLLKDVPQWGPKGALVPVPFGRMRNQYFPQRLAEYVRAPELREIRVKDVKVQRDFTFTGEKPKVVQGPVIESPDFKPKPVTERLSPQRSTELLSILIPDRLDFFRMPIGAQGVTTLDSSSTAPTPQHENMSIHGSVSPADIVIAVREMLAANEEASRVVLAEEEVHFSSGNIEAGTNRIKHLGEYEISIRLAGGPGAIKKRVRVLDPRPNAIQSGSKPGGPLNAGGPQRGANAFL